MFLSTNERIALLRPSDGKLLAEKALAYGCKPVVLPGGKLFLLQTFKKNPLVLEAYLGGGA